MEAEAKQQQAVSPWRSAMATLWAWRWKVMRRVGVLVALRLLAEVCGVAPDWAQPVCAAIAHGLEAIP